MTRTDRKRLLIVVTVLAVAAVAAIVLPLVTSRETADSWHGIFRAAPVFAVFIAMAWDNFSLRSGRNTTV